jgi:hypothetical protein
VHSVSKGRLWKPFRPPKKAPDFDEQLLREARSLVTINERGRKIRVSKHDVAVKQLLNNAMKGNASAQRMYFDVSRQAFEKNAQSEAQDAKEIERLKRPEELTMEELEWLALGGDPKELLRRRKK